MRGNSESEKVIPPDATLDESVKGEVPVEKDGAKAPKVR